MNRKQRRAAGPSAPPGFDPGREMQKAVQLHQAGDLPAAGAIYERILERYPDHPDALHLLGLVVHAADETERAISLIRRAIEIQPNFVRAHNNLGNLLKEQGNLGDAAQHYQRTIELDPRHAMAHYNLGKILAERNSLDDAAAHYRRAIGIDPNYAKAHTALGNVFQDQGNTEDAFACHRRALALNPRYAEAFYGMGRSFQILGQFDEATVQFEKALSIDPNHAPSYQSLAAMKKVKPGDDLILKLQRILESTGQSRKNQTGLHFALGKCFNDTGEFDQAFEHYRAANELKKLDTPFDIAGFESHVDRIIETFSRQVIEEKAALGSRSELPVFVVGMPRSGTTLVEQILGSHPEVVGVGELPLLGQLAADIPQFEQVGLAYPEYAPQLDATAVQQMSDEYLGHVTPLAGGAARLIDKELGNLFRLGLIAILFSHARIIHCKRDPMDVCLSCYLQDFANQSFASDLDHIGRYYRAIDRLMNHWASILPSPVLDVQYEEMIGDQEAMSRRMIEFCGLDWDDACLSFHETERSVLTASIWQVRQPIYKTSVERWRRYEKHLGALKRALGISG